MERATNASSSILHVYEITYIPARGMIPIEPTRSQWSFPPDARVSHQRSDVGFFDGGNFQSAYQNW